MSYWTNPLPGIMGSKEKQTGTVWTSVTRTGSWASVGYGNGVWIIVGSPEDYLRSTDNGLTWTALPFPTVSAQSWNRVIYGNGTWIAVSSGPYGDARVMRSIDDGLTWTGIDVPVLQYRSVGYGNGVWIIVASNANPRILRSIDDGLTWSGVFTSSTGTASLTDVYYANGTWIAVGGGTTGRVVRSVNDGLTWSVITIDIIAGNPATVKYNNGLWLLAGSTLQIGKSVDDGLTWIITNDLTDIISVAYIDVSNDVWIAVGSSGNNRLVRSVDNMNTLTFPISPALPILRGIAHNGPIWIAVGNGTIWRSIE